MVKCSYCDEINKLLGKDIINDDEDHCNFCKNCVVKVENVLVDGEINRGSIVRTMSHYASKKSKCKITNKYAYTKARHFDYILEDKKTINSELEYKLKTQFNCFSDEFKKTSLIYDFNNFISYNYLLKKLIDLNENPEFTKTPILIKTNFEKNKLIHLSLLNKCFMGISKMAINEYLFNVTCENLSWYKLV